MSVNKEKDVSKLVEKYRCDFPTLERRFLRKLIRSENKIENPSELKKLDRYLKKAFKNEGKPSTENPSQQDDFKFYIEHGLITKDELAVQAVCRALVQTLPEDNPQRAFAKLLIIANQEKMKMLKDSFFK